MRATETDLSNIDAFAAGPPWRVFADLRAADPVHWNAEKPPHHGFWSITRYGDVVGALRNEDAFSTELGGSKIEELDDASRQARRSMLETDGPRHRALRHLLHKDFSAATIAQYDGYLREVTRAIIDRALCVERFDFVAEVAAAIPAKVLGRMLDVPEPDADRLTEWSNRMFGVDDPDYAHTQICGRGSGTYQHLPFSSPAALEVYEYGLALRAQREDGNGTDLVSRLVNQTPRDGVPLSDVEFRANFALLVAAGNETTRHAMSHGVRALIARPEQLALLQRRPELIGNAVKETLRWASPIVYVRRTAKRDVELHGRRIKRGDKVVFWLASANHDEDLFDRPDSFDAARTNVDHVGFGGGPHYCLGGSMAWLEVKILLEEMLPRVTAITHRGPVTLMRSNYVHGIKAMPVDMV